MKKIGNFFER